MVTDQQQNDTKMINMKTIVILTIFSTFTFFSCGNKQENEQVYRQENSEATVSMELAPVLQDNESFAPSKIIANEEVEEADNAIAKTLGDNSVNSKKKIIKDGIISVKTSEINASKKGIDDLLKKLNGYYESEDLQNYDQKISYNLKIRVPADNFEKLILSIENGKDEIKSKSIHARDVTEEYLDIETRLTNKREYLKRYKQLLSKASTVKDILEIEENIRTLQEEIESKVGRLKYLNDQVSFSTLDIHLYKEKEFVYKPQPQDKFSERVKTSLSSGWTSVLDLVLWTITIWPYIIVIMVAFFIIRLVIKKRQSRQKV